MPHRLTRPLLLHLEALAGLADSGVWVGADWAHHLRLLQGPGILWEVAPVGLVQHQEVGLEALGSASDWVSVRLGAPIPSPRPPHRYQPQLLRRKHVYPQKICQRAIAA